MMAGKHFASYETTSTIFTLLPDTLPSLTRIEWNRFAPYHGKSDCDSHFGLIAKYMKQIEKVAFVNTIDDFVKEMTNKSKNSKYPTTIVKIEKSKFTRTVKHQLEFGYNAANKITNTFTMIMTRIGGKTKFYRKNNASAVSELITVTKVTKEDARQTKSFVPASKDKSTSSPQTSSSTVPSVSIVPTAPTSATKRILPPVANTMDIANRFKISMRITSIPNSSLSNVTEIRLVNPEANPNRKRAREGNHSVD